MLWDEFPLMLHNLQQREGSDSAIQLLDHLRALRLARADRLRFLFTGSIGLHLVLRSLRKAGHTRITDLQDDLHLRTLRSRDRWPNSAVDLFVDKCIKQRNAAIPDHSFQRIVGLVFVEPRLFVDPLQ